MKNDFVFFLPRNIINIFWTTLDQLKRKRYYGKQNTLYTHPKSHDDDDNDVTYLHRTPTSVCFVSFFSFELGNLDETEHYRIMVVDKKSFIIVIRVRKPQQGHRR